MKLSAIPLVREVFSLLYWTMLAACTVGPGTVVTCSRNFLSSFVVCTWCCLKTYRMLYSYRSISYQCFTFVLFYVVAFLWTLMSVCWVVGGWSVCHNVLKCRKVTGWSLNSVFFSKILKYSGLLPFSVFPRSQCVYTLQAGRTPALQQNWQSSEKSQNFKEKHNN